MKPSRADALLAAVLAAALLLQLALHDHEGAAAVNVIGGIALTLPLAFRRRAPVAVITVFSVAAVVNEALGGALFTFTETRAADAEPPIFAALAAGIVAFYSLGVYAGERRALLGALGGVVGLWVTVVVSDQVEISSFIWSGGLVAATPWLAGRVVRSRRQRIASQELEQEQRTQIALSDERTRIARELHDVVAHSVGVIVVQAQGARRVIDRDPARAEQALATIEDTARTALGEMRRSLGILRDAGAGPALAPQPGVGDLDDLIATARASGLDVELAVEGVARVLSQGLDLSVYRIVQEALTNTIKHAGYARSRVTLRYGERTLEIEVEDDGPGPPPDAAGSPGHGLVGMRERVSSHGGELEAGAGRGGGFVVRATLAIDR